MKYDKKQVAKWIEKYWTGSKKCQVCESDAWVLFDRVWEIREFNEGDMVVGGDGGSVVPIVTMMCNVCGQMIFFNAVATRAVKVNGDQGEKNNDSK